MKRRRFSSTQLFLLVGAILGAGLAWRWVARQRSLPCPYWLSFLLDNPYTEAVMGANTILNRVGLEPGMKVLDAGCGPGRLTVPAAQRVGPTGEVVGLDVQPEMLIQVQEKAQAAGLQNIRLILAEIEEAGLEQASFDRALLVTVLGEIPDRLSAMQQIINSLKPGGILSITEILPDPHYQRRKTVLRLAQEAGFHPHSHFGNWWAYTQNLVKPNNF